MERGNDHHGLLGSVLNWLHHHLRRYSGGHMGEAAMTMPTQEQIDTAVMWLEGNEGDSDERGACLAVAEWLKQQAFERMLRSEARKAGVTVANLRRKLAEPRP